MALSKAEQIPQIKEVYFSNPQVGWIGTNVIESYSALLYHTANGGQNWEKRHVGGKGTIDQFQFLADGLHGWMAGLFSGDFYRTFDGGVNWENMAFGSSTHILGFHFLNENLGWALPNVVGLIDDTNTIQDTEGSIWKTTDGSRNFHMQYGWLKEAPDIGEDFPSQDTSPGPQFLDLSFVDAEHGWALGRTTFGQSMHKARVFFTNSGGADWTVLSRIDLGVHRICFSNQLRGFALHWSNDEPVFETRDGGRNWYPRQDILQLVHGGFDSNWGDVAFADDQYGWIVFNGDTNLYEGTRILLRTTDGGNTWETINETERGGFHNLFFLDREHGWMVNNFGFIEGTTNGGETWVVQRDLSDGNADLKAIHFTDELSGWAVGMAGFVLSTTDGGNHWDQDATDSSTDFNDVYFSTCLKGWFGGEAHPSSGKMGDPVLIETKSGSFQTGIQIPLQPLNHNIRIIDSPDTVNVWALGDFGLGMKYSAPTNTLMVTTPTVPAGRLGQTYLAQLESENGSPPLNWRICGGALPPGLTLQPNGQIVGTPTASATFRFVAAVFDSAGESAGKKFPLRVEPASVPTIVTAALPDGQVGADYAVVLDATGTVRPYDWQLFSGQVPPGIDLMPYGAIGGVPSIPGLYEFGVLVSDGQAPHGSASRELSIKVQGRVVSAGSGPCDEFPLFCLARHWGNPVASSEGDLDGDGDVDAADALRVLQDMHLR